MLTRTAPDALFEILVMPRGLNIALDRGHLAPWIVTPAHAVRGMRDSLVEFERRSWMAVGPRRIWATPLRRTRRMDSGERAALKRVPST